MSRAPACNDAHARHRLPLARASRASEAGKTASVPSRVGSSDGGLTTAAKNKTVQRIEFESVAAAGGA